MPARTLTDPFVKNVRKPDPSQGKRQEAYIETLERGLALVLSVSYGGTKTFRVLTYENGRPRSRKLGTYPRMSVKEARGKAREFWQNPEKYLQTAAVGTFEKVALNWLHRHVDANKLRSAAEIRRQLTKYVFPKWRSRPFVQIRRHDVNELLDYIADHHGRSQADAVLATLRSLMSWHQARDENYITPIVRGMRRKKPTRRDRVLSEDEISRLWVVATETGTFGAFVKMLLLTAQRKEKVATMRWCDIENGTWIIPAAPREKGTAKTLRLPPLALSVVHEQPRLQGNPFVFAGRGAVALNAFSQRKAEFDGRFVPNSPWVLHDLRRTARSLLSRAGVRPDIAERVLGHAVLGVEGIYDRHGYEAEKADALLKLEELLRSVAVPESAETGNRTLAA